MGLPGSQRDVERLVEEHYLPLYRYAFRLSGSSADAEDLAQETFCKAQMSYGQLRDPGRAKPWLFRILRNLYLHKLRSEKKQTQVSLEDTCELPERVPEEDDVPIEPERLQEALDGMAEEFKTPVILFYFEDFSYRDIAEHMDVPLGTVMSRLARAKTFLRARLLTPEHAAARKAWGGGKDGL